MNSKLLAGQTSVWSRIWKTFWNEQEGRLRAFWRVLLQLVTAAIIIVVSEIAFSVLLGEKTIFSVVFSESNVASLGFVASVWLAARFLDRRPFADFGLRLNKAWWVDVGFGLVLGALMQVGQFLMGWANGWITVTDTFYTADTHLPFAVILLFSLVTFLGVGTSEELVSRGYQLRNLNEGLNFPFVGPRIAILLALILSSSVFGLLHLVMHANTDTGLLDNLLSILPQTLAGLMLGVAYLLTGQLAIPIGIHTAVNFFGVSIFGSGESGAHFPSLFTVEPTVAGQDVLASALPNVLFEALLWVPVVLLIVLWVSRRYGRIVLHTFLAYPSQR
jgi:CAAX protease family protein